MGYTIQQRRDYQNKRKDLFRDGAKALFNDTCTRCGYDKHWEVLVFHHIIPREISGRPKITDIMRHSWKKVRDEVLGHCTLLCPTCHSEVHLEMENEKKDSVRSGGEWTEANQDMDSSCNGIRDI